MGYMIGMPSLKLSNVWKENKHAGFFRDVVSEALEERYGKDKDIDREKTKNNEYVIGFRTAKELIEYSDRTIERMKKEIEENNQNPKLAKRRTIRKDAVVMCALIIKPPAEMMNNLSDEDQDKFLKDTLYEVADIVGVGNIKAAVIHKDERVRHMHIFWQPITEDGRLCAKEMHNQKNYFDRLNHEMPKNLRLLGWDIDECRAYDKKSEEQKKAKQNSGRSSKVFKYEMDKKVEALEQELIHLQGTIDGILNEAKEQGNKVAMEIVINATAQKRAIEDEIKVKQQEADKASERLQQAEKQAKEIETQNQEANVKLTKAQHEVNELLGEVQQIRNSVSSWKGKGQEVKQEVTTLQAQLQQLQDNILRLQEQENEAKRRLSEQKALEAEIERHVSELQAEEQRITSDEYLQELMEKEKQVYGLQKQLQNALRNNEIRAVTERMLNGDQAGRQRMTQAVNDMMMRRQIKPIDEDKPVEEGRNPNYGRE